MANKGSSGPNHAESGYFAVLDLTLARIVNGAVLAAIISIRGGRDGAIAQLGERVVRNDEVGGSIPPGSTSLRRLRQLRPGKPYRSEGCRGVARRAEPGLGKPIVAKAAAS